MFETNSLIVILVIGLIAGWLAGKIVEGTGLGLIGDIVVGLVGAFIGRQLLHLTFNVNHWVNDIATATIGAVFLLVVIKLIRRL